MLRRRRSPLGGCDFAADPDKFGASAKAFWRVDEAPTIVSVLAPSPPFLPSRITLQALAPLAARRDGHGLHFRLANGNQLLIVGDPEPFDPLALLLPIDAYLHTRSLTAATSLPLRPPLDALTNTQRRRHRRALQAWDGRQTGASEREIAEVIFGAGDLPHGAAWKSDSLRAQTVRLVDAASRRVRGGYRALLRLAPPARRRR